MLNRWVGGGVAVGLPFGVVALASAFGLAAGFSGSYARYLDNLVGVDMSRAGLSLFLECVRRPRDRLRSFRSLSILFLRKGV